MAQNVKIDEYNLYAKSATNSWKLGDKKWLSNDDIKFADCNKFEEEIKGLLQIRRKNLIPSGIEEKNYKLMEEKIPVKDIRNDSDLVLSCNAEVTRPLIT